MTQQLQQPIDDLRGSLAGTVVGPDDADYDEARKVWNAAIDRRPALIAKCTSAKDVSAAVTFAVEQGLEIAVRCGAHSMSGSSTVDDGIVIDLSELNAVTVDADARRAKVGGGALLGDVDRAAQEHGLAVPAGMVSHTGVGGLTLGGGMGWLTRRAGLSVDNIVSAEVVLADGQIVRASADEHADLYWAIRGGGGNFGVVTEFEFRLHEVGPMIQFGMLFWGLDQGADVLRLARELYKDLPLDLSILLSAMNAPPMPFVPEDQQLKPGYALLVVGFGAEDSHSAMLDRMRTALPPAWEIVTPMPWVALQQLIDEANAWGRWDYDKGLYVDDITDDVIETITAHMPAKQSPLTVVLFYRLDEAYAAVSDDDTAFSGQRRPGFAVFMIAVCPVPELFEPERQWVRSLHDALAPFARDTHVYVNALTEADHDRVKAAYGPAKYERLAQIKGKYDPANVFHRNANIQPV